MNLLGATIPGWSGPGSDGNKEVLHVTQISSMTDLRLSMR